MEFDVPSKPNWFSLKKFEIRFFLDDVMTKLESNDFNEAVKMANFWLRDYDVVEVHETESKRCVKTIYNEDYKKELNKEDEIFNFLKQGMRGILR